MKTCRSKKVFSTVHQSRVPIFSPTRRPTKRVQCAVETAWGRVRVTGRLGQRHRDLLDALDDSTLQKVTTTDGCQHRLVDPHKLRAILGRKGGRAAAGMVEGLVKDLTEALLQIDTTSGLHILGHIFDEARWHEGAGPGEAARFGRDARRLYRLKMGAAWCQFIQKDLQFSYDRKLIGALQYGVSQAVARLLLTHRGCTRVEVDTALEQVGVGPGERQPLWDARRRLAGDREGLLGLGIVINQGMITVRRSSAGAESPVAGAESPVL